MAKPSVYFTLPSWDLLKFPPDPLPPTLPPPIGERTFRSPFGVQPWLFNLAMEPIVPFTFAAVYVVTVLYVNAYNRSKGNQPWWISRQKFFKHFVVLHNVVLAIYSAATFIAMFRAISHSLPAFGDSTGTAGIADSLCKLHGPRVLGDAITFNSTINIWESKNQLIKLTGGNPDPTDAGRLWNEGLAFWGWMFYLSKFYEVVDTFIIVSKGKRSATLQTYHHAGAMLCMWAGMRYMSPPIWMFVFVNSFIHSLMYVYFALTTLDYKVPQYVKRSLTSMQIAQFLWGSVYAGAHLFVAYDIPVATPYKVAAKVAAITSSASSAYSAASSAASSVIESRTIGPSLGLFIKKLLLRAAGEEGVAERLAVPAVTDKPIAEVIESKLEEARERIFHQPSHETKWHTDLTKVNCIDTSGEAFAIWLNLLYLAPLTFLFVRFFVRAYLNHGSKSKNVKEAVNTIKEDAKLAEAETESAVEKAGKRAEDVVKNGSAELKKDVKSLHDQLREDVRKFKKGEYTSPKLNERIEKFEKQVKDLTEKARQSVKDGTESAKQQVKDGAESAKQQAKDVTDSVTNDEHETDDEHDESGEDKENLSPSSSQSPHTPDKKKKRKHKKKKHDASSAAEGSADVSASQQDAVLAASEPQRPGTTDAIDNDTDAMGKSGVGVDLSKSATDAARSS